MLKTQICVTRPQCVNVIYHSSKSNQTTIFSIRKNKVTCRVKFTLCEQNCKVHTWIHNPFVRRHTNSVSSTIHRHSLFRKDNITQYYFFMPCNAPFSKFITRRNSTGQVYRRSINSTVLTVLTCGVKITTFLVREKSSVIRWRHTLRLDGWLVGGLVGWLVVGLVAQHWWLWLWWVKSDVLGICLSLFSSKTVALAWIYWGEKTIYLPVASLRSGLELGTSRISVVSILFNLLLRRRAFGLFV